MPEFYQIYLKSQLEPCQYLLLSILIDIAILNETQTQSYWNTPTRGSRFPGVCKSNRIAIVVQSIKMVKLEALATALPLPIKFESRRHRLQRFLSLPILKVEKLWFPEIFS